MKIKRIMDGNGNTKIGGMHTINAMKKILFVFALVAANHLLYSQTDEQKVKDVLSSCKNALEKLDVKGTDVIFVANSLIIESGKVEGTFSR